MNIRRTNVSVFAFCGLLLLSGLPGRAEAAGPLGAGLVGSVWSSALGGGGSDAADCLALDATGNTYVAGVFRDTMTIGETTHVSAGGSDIFLVKHDALGRVLWSAAFGGPQDQYVYGIALDGAGRVALTGTYWETVDFGGGPLPTATLVDLFVAVLDTDGAFVRADGYGAAGAQVGFACEFDPSGALVVAGYFDGQLDLGGGPFALLDERDVFLAKFDGTGQHLWSRAYPGTGTQDVEGLDVAADGAIALCGGMLGDVDFGGGSLAHAGLEDAYLALFDAAGMHLASWSFGDAALQQGQDVAFDGAGNLVFCGENEGSFAIGAQMVSGSGVFTAKIDRTGAPLWSFSVDTDVALDVHGLDVSGAGDMAITGTLGGTADFGGGPLTSAHQGLFVALFDNAGAHLWSAAYGDTARGSQVAVDGARQIYVAGWFEGALDLGLDDYLSGGEKDGLVARISPLAPFMSVSPDSLHWDQQEWGMLDAEEPQEFTITNRGGVQLTGSIVGIDNVESWVTDIAPDTYDLAPDESVTIVTTALTEICYDAVALDVGPGDRTIPFTLGPVFYEYGSQHSSLPDTVRLMPGAIGVADTFSFTVLNTGCVPRLCYLDLADTTAGFAYSGPGLAIPAEWSARFDLTYVANSIVPDTTTIVFTDSNELTETTVLIGTLTLPRYYVATDGADSNSGGWNDPFLTIQRGLDAAAPGDTVMVRDGSYSGPGNHDLRMNGKALVVMSQSGVAAQCVIDCAGAAPGSGGFIFDGDETRASIVQNLRIINAGSAGAIHCTGDAPGEGPHGASPTVIGCELVGAVANGVDVFGGESFPRFDACRSDSNGTDGFWFHESVGLIYDSIASGNGRNGISFNKLYVFPEDTVRIVRCTTNDNRSSGVVWMSEFRHADIIDCTAEENDEDGFVFLCGENATATYRGCVARANDDRGFDTTGDAYESTTMRDCRFIDNLGDGVRLGGLMADIDSCTISGNGGVGLEFYLGRQSIVRNTLISNNAQGGIAGTLGGEGNDNTAFFENCVIAANHGPGVAVEVGPEIADFTCTNLTIADNDSTGLRITGLPTVITNNLVTGNGGLGLDIATPDTALIGCNNVWDNGLGNWPAALDSSLAASNISTDPRYCTDPEAPYALSASSPCLDAASVCGLIGAVGEGCGPLPGRAIHVATDGDDWSSGQPGDPVRTIQRGIDLAAVAGDSVLVADGTYGGPGNFDISLRGKAVLVASVSDIPDSCVIDCTDPTPRAGFWLDQEEGRDTELRGFRITNAARVGAVVCTGRDTLQDEIIDGASPTLRRLHLSGNGVAGAWVAGVTTSPLFLGCRADSNSSDGFRVHDGEAEFEDCRATKNAGYGFYLRDMMHRGYNAYTGSWRDCTATGNGSDGFFWEADFGSIDLAGCTADSNGGHGFSVLSIGYKKSRRQLAPDNSKTHVPTGIATVSRCTSRANTGHGVWAPDLFFDLTMTASLLESNGASGALLQSCYVTIDSCAFDGNVGHGLEFSLFDSDRFLVSNSTFTDNEGRGIQGHTGWFAGGVGQQGVVVSHCVVSGSELDGLRLTADGAAGAARLTNLTVADNDSAGVWASGPVTIDNCLSALNGGLGLSVADTTETTVTCTDSWGNAGGDWSANLLPLTDGNFSADPEFCAEPADAYTISASSPCAAANNGCGLVGAREVGCGEVITTAFTDLAVLVLSDPSHSTGVAWVDVDSNGFDDLYVTRAGGEPNLLLANDGYGSLAACTPLVIADGGHATGSSWADGDGDLFPDVAVAHYQAPNHLAVNDGVADLSCWGFSEGEFLTPAAETVAVQWVDLELDGTPEVYFSNHAGPNELQRAPTSTVHGVPAGLEMDLPTQGFGWCDMDGDFDPDLCIAMEDNTLLLARQQEDGSFAIEPSLAPISGQGVSWVDFDNDGDFDLYLTYWGQGNRLLVNDGSGSFTDEPQAALADTNKSQAGAWGDFDNDGYQDVYLTNWGQADGLWRNENGSGAFTEIMEPGLRDTSRSIGAAWSDFDNDGDLDLCVATEGDRDRLYRNNLDNGNAWLQVELKGHPGQANGSALGARVTVEAGGLTQVRYVAAGSGYASQNSLVQHFGLGAAAVVDRIQVVWPWRMPDGAFHTTELTGEATGQRLVISEPGLDPSAVVMGDGPPRVFALAGAYPNPFNPMTTIAFDLPRAVTADLRIYDLKGRLVKVLVGGEELPAGRHEAVWRGRDSGGRAVATGVYFYRLEAGSFTATRRMLLLK